MRKPRPSSPRTLLAGHWNVGTGLALVLCAIALASPAATTATPRKATVKLPSCSHFSLAKIVSHLGGDPFKFAGASPVGDACTYLSLPVAGDYETLVQISLAATPKSVFLSAQHKAFRSEPVGATDWTFKSGRSMTVHGLIYFYVDQTITPNSLPPCNPGQRIPELGPPLCSGEPASRTISFYTYGPIKHQGPNVFLSVAVSAEANQMIGPLNAAGIDYAILSGKIH